MGEYLAMAFLIVTSLLGIILLARLCLMRICGGACANGVHVLPVSGEVECLEWMLRRLLYRGAKRIIVVDLGCAAQTREVLRRFCTDHGAVTLIRADT